MVLRIAGVVLALSGMLLGASDTEKRLDNAEVALKEAMTMPDQGIPQDLLDKAHCVVIVPGMKKGAFIVGGQFGRGFINCRQSDGNGWTAPGAVRVEGGSIGFQIGGSETDIIILVMNESGKGKLLSSKFTIGADAAAAAGPVGRKASALTDAQMRAEMLTYSRSRGVFAGISLEGATMRPDNEAIREIYGKELTNKEIVSGSVSTPAAAKELVSMLTKYSMKESN